MRGICSAWLHTVLASGREDALRVAVSIVGKILVYAPPPPCVCGDALLSDPSCDDWLRCVFNRPISGRLFRSRGVLNRIDARPAVLCHMSARYGFGVHRRFEHPDLKAAHFF